MTFGEYFYSSEGESWISPDGYSDPSNTWNDEPNAYDGNTSTATLTSIDVKTWSGFLYLTFSTPIKSKKLRIYVLAHVFDLFDIDAKVNGRYTLIYHGKLENRTWIEKVFNEGLIDEIRIRVYRPLSSAMSIKQIFEIQVLEVAEPDNGNNGEPSKGCLMMALFGTTLLARCFPYLRLFRDRVLPQIITDSYYAFSTWILGVVG